MVFLFYLFFFFFEAAPCSQGTQPRPSSSTMLREALKVTQLIKNNETGRKAANSNERNTKGNEAAKH